LCGPRTVIEEARHQRHRLGGSMRQAGVIAAAGIVALETMVDRLADDHDNAQRLALALAERWPGCVDPDVVRTNIVCVPAAMLPRDLISGLARERVIVGMLDHETVRFVTHHDVDEHDMTRVIKALDTVGR
jgi:threonine aldolase